MLFVGVDYTGYYLNPINATNQTFGCRGVSLLEHLVVYWLGPLGAAALGTYIHPHLKAKWNSYRQASARHALLFSPSMTFEELRQEEAGEGNEVMGVDESWEVIGTENMSPAPPSGPDVNHNVQETWREEEGVSQPDFPSSRLRPRKKKQQLLNGSSN